MNTPILGNLNEINTADDVLHRIAVQGYSPDQTVAIFRELENLWPAMDEDRNFSPDTLSVEDFVHVSRVLNAAHDDPKIMKRFLKTREDVGNIASIIHGDNESPGFDEAVNS